MKKKSSGIKWIATLCILTLGIVSFTAKDEYFEISRNIDIFTTLFRELNIYYVDKTDPEELVRKGIDSMLEGLDPYTQFIPESEIDDYRFMTTGQYGGVGALIGQRGDSVIITDPYEGFPAQKSGILAGDIIKEVNGVKVAGKRSDEVSKLLKGQPRTTVNLILQRPGENALISKSMTREEIRINNVPFYGMLDEKIGYIRLSSFTEDAGSEVKEALTDLKAKNKLEGVILDLRNNPGGLLNEAVNIVNVFIDRGQEVVSTRGKVREWDKTYKALNTPVDTEMPLAILVNSGSASASEIVSGSLQDLDRAIVIGQRTFGKGLVQTTRPLSYNTQLKVTTAKYYIPSGRCIQALDYAHRNADGSVGKVPDSLINAFKTKGGRKVYDGGGIAPDAATDPLTFTSISQSLVTKYLFFDYATKFRQSHPSIVNARTFRLDDAAYNDFVTYLRTKDYDYTTESEKKLAELKTDAEKEKYFDAIKTEFENVQKKLMHDKNEDLKTHKTEIKELLENEIVSRYYYQNGRIENGFDYDPDVILALKALHTPAVFDAIKNRTYKN